MRINDVQIKLARPDHHDPRLKGFASFTVDRTLAVKRCVIIEIGDRLVVNFPCQKAYLSQYPTEEPQGRIHRDPMGEYWNREIVHPISMEAREMVESVVLDAYRQILASGRTGGLVVTGEGVAIDAS